jgi:hypothetical protein
MIPLGSAGVSDSSATRRKLTLRTAWSQTGKVVEFFLGREATEAMIAEVREGELALAVDLRVEAIRLRLKGGLSASGPSNDRLRIADSGYSQKLARVRFPPPELHGLYNNRRIAREIGNLEQSNRSPVSAWSLDAALRPAE